MISIDDHMPHTRAAIARLGEALLRLESAVTESRQNDLFMEQELASSRDGYARLDETSRMVEERLDAAIHRLRSVLEE